MAEPYLGEIRLFGFNFPPRNWARCDGALLSIAQNQALYSILGTTYGGDGRTSFALPDLRGRTPLHTEGTSFQLGQKAGEETHSLSVNEIPAHTHQLRGASDTANSPIVSGNMLATSVPTPIYGPVASSSTVHPHSGTVQNTGNGQGHENMMPSIAVNFCIAIVGLFPPRN